ncbi:MAG: ABC transporter ATP-binding protein [Phototrophicales bacterium]
MLRSRRRQQQNDQDRDVPDVPIYWRELLGYLRPYRGRLLLAVLATLASAGLSLIFPMVVQQVLDSVLDQRNLDLLNQITVLLLFVFILRSFTSFLETYNLNYIGERILMDVRRNLYNHLQGMSLGFFVERRVGELVSRLSSDVTVLRTVLTNNITTLLSQTATLFGAISLMFILNWRLTLFILLMIPVIVVIGFVFGYYMRRISTQVQDELAGSTIVAEEVFQGIREVKSFVREPYEIARYNDAIQRAFHAAVRLLRIRSILGPVIAFMAFGGLTLILWFGGREVIAGRLSGGELIAFLIYGLTVAANFASLIGLYTSFQEALGATKRVFEILQTQPDITDKPDAIVLDKVSGRITFDHVTFSYDNKLEVLNDISLDIAAGEILALVGPSGAGKSTLFNLIPRFYDPTSGSIQVDGIDLRDVTQASLREQIAIVPQETLLFGGTIRENIRYGRLDATEEDIIEAAKIANAHEFIMGLPDGYDTIVGERGIKLSGGQRQRVAIARAVLKNPRILLLDEATSSLDNESEHLVQEALGRLMQGRTTVIIAHRLSTVRVAHRVAVLDRGKLVEIGTHDELLAHKGLYAHLYELQFREDDLQDAALQP